MSTSERHQLPRCPRCGAGEGNPCRTQKHRATQAHQERWAAYVEEMELRRTQADSERHPADTLAHYDDDTLVAVAERATALLAERGINVRVRPPKMGPAALEYLSDLDAELARARAARQAFIEQFLVTGTGEGNADIS